MGYLFGNHDPINSDSINYIVNGLRRFLISMSVTEVWKYGKPDIIFGFHNFRSFPNFLMSKENVLREIVNFHNLLLFNLLFLLNVLN
jgi:hypothetical protein